jgi:peptidoglycan/LPS O-acetylase OafA/YrhL
MTANRPGQHSTQFRDLLIWPRQFQVRLYREPRKSPNMDAKGIDAQHFGIWNLKREHIPALDGLRGVAVLLVILFHAGDAPYGWIGVDVFFALSGFLITGILLDAKTSGARGGAYYLPFYTRRCLRIFPLAFGTMTFVFLIAPPLALMPAVPFGEQVWYWTYLSNWYEPRSVSSGSMIHFWSLALEEQFYLIWPWVVLAANRRRLWWICLALLLLAPMLRFAVTVLPIPDPLGNFYDRMTPLRMDGLAAGALIAIISREPARLDRYRRLALPIFLLSAATFALLQWNARDGVANFVLVYSILAVGGAACIVCILTNSPVFRCLTMRWLMWTGTVSYGAYVVHLPLESALAQINTIELFGATFGLAAISWYAFEAPILRLRLQRSAIA